MKVQNRNIITIVVLAIIPILLTGFLNYSIGLKNTKEIGVQEISSVVELLSNNLDIYSELFREDIAFLKEAYEKDEYERFDKSLKMLLNKRGLYKRIEVYDQKTKSKIKIENNIKNNSYLEWIDDLSRIEVKDSIPFITNDINEFNLISNFTEKQGENFYVNLIIDKTKFLGETEKVKVGKTGYAFIIDGREGRLISHPNNDLIGKKLTEVVPSFNQLLNGTWDSTKPFEYIFENKEKFLSYTSCKNYGWLIMAGTYYEEIEEKFASAKKVIFGSIILVIILSLVGVRTTNNSFVKPIKNISENLKLVAKGDFTVKLDEVGDYEVKELAKDFNKFIDEFGSLIGSIKLETIEIVDSNLIFIEEIRKIINGSKEDKGIVDLNTSIRNSMDNIRNQTASTQETYAAIEEIRGGADSNMISSQKTLSIVESSVKLGLEGKNAIDKLGEKMESISEQVGETEKEIIELRSLSHDISDITEAINNLSERTNLLSFNATIEAARAGESGKGFAVVADEIKKLADKTKQESDKIKIIVNNISEKISRVRMSTDNVRVKVEEGVENNISVDNALCSIVESINETNIQAKEIYRLTDEQRLASEEIGKAIESISTSAELIERDESENLDTVAGIEKKLLERVEFLDQLSTRMKNLEKELNKFNLN